MIRKILAAIAGYAIFVITSLALFKFSGKDPHADPAISFVILTAIYGVLFSFVSGIVTSMIAKAADLKANYILAFILAGFAAFSFFKTGGNHWTQLLAVFIFAPASIFGGIFYNSRYKK
jgi:O-antigen ligase